jgi:hypothetical protein
VREVEDHLVVGVGVDGGHVALLDAEAVEQDLGHGHDRVGGAGGVGDDVVAGRVVDLVVDADHDGHVLVLRRGGDDHLLGAALEVQRGAVPVGEAAGRLDHDVDAEVAPGELGGVALGEGADPGAVDRDRLVVVGDVAVEAPEGGVVLEQVGEGVVVGEVVDRHDLDVQVMLGDGGGVPGRPEEVAADAAEAVDPHADGSHHVLPSMCSVGPSGYAVTGQPGHSSLAREQGANLGGCSPGATATPAAATAGEAAPAEAAAA